MLHGVGGELVQDHAERKRRLGRQHRERSRLQFDARAIAILRCDCPPDHFKELRLAPVRLEQERMGIGHCPQPPQQIVDVVIDVVAGLDGPSHQRHDHSHRVLDPVAELADQEFLLVLGPSALHPFTSFCQGALDRCR